MNEGVNKAAVGCTDVGDYLMAHDDIVVLNLPPDIADHLDSCARCRLEFEHNRNLAADLRQLAEQVVEPPVWLLGTLTETTIERLRRRAGMRATGKQLAQPRVLAGGAILIAGVAGALMVRGRVKRRMHQAPAAA